MTTKMRPIRDTIPMDDALRIVTDAACPLTRTNLVPLENANGLVLATEIVANIDYLNPRLCGLGKAQNRHKRGRYQ